MDTDGWREHSYTAQLRYQWQLEPSYQYFQYRDYFDTDNVRSSLFAFLADGADTVHIAGADLFWMPDDTVQAGIRVRRYDYDLRTESAYYDAGLLTLTAAACSSCHAISDPVDCAACHQSPPQGASAPNRNGSHAAHIALSGLGDDCRTCHDGAGSGSAVHTVDTDQDVRMLALFTPKTGMMPQCDPATHTCANVSCHGGQTTPDWYGGSIDVENECTACHSAGTTQYNSYNDQAHREGAHRNLSCTDCHDPEKIALTHFTNLATPGFDGNPEDTLGNCSSCHD